MANLINSEDSCINEQGLAKICTPLLCLFEVLEELPLENITLC